jgi:hypothetical protein
MVPGPSAFQGLNVAREDMRARARMQDKHDGHMSTSVWATVWDQLGLQNRAAAFDPSVARY